MVAASFAHHHRLRSFVRISDVALGEDSAGNQHPDRLDFSEFKPPRARLTRGVLFLAESSRPRFCSMTFSPEILLTTLTASRGAIRRCAECFARGFRCSSTNRWTALQRGCYGRRRASFTCRPTGGTFTRPQATRMGWWNISGPRLQFPVCAGRRQCPVGSTRIRGCSQ